MIRERNGLKELHIFWEFKYDMELPKYKANAKSHGFVISENDGSITLSSRRSHKKKMK